MYKMGGMGDLSAMKSVVHSPKTLEALYSKLNMRLYYLVNIFSSVGA